MLLLNQAEYSMHGVCVGGRLAWVHRLCRGLAPHGPVQVQYCILSRLGPRRDKVCATATATGRVVVAGWTGPVQPRVCTVQCSIPGKDHACMPLPCMARSSERSQRFTRARLQCGNRKDRYLPQQMRCRAWATGRWLAWPAAVSAAPATLPPSAGATAMKRGLPLFEQSCSWNGRTHALL